MYDTSSYSCSKFNFIHDISTCFLLCVPSIIWVRTAFASVVHRPLDARNKFHLRKQWRVIGVTSHLWHGFLSSVLKDGWAAKNRAGFLKFQEKKPTVSTKEGDFTMEQEQQLSSFAAAFK